MAMGYRHPPGEGAEGTRPPGGMTESRAGFWSSSSSLHKPGVHWQGVQSHPAFMSLML